MINLADYALNNRALVKFFIAVLVIGGIFAFNSMSKLEDPEIKVKQAMVVTVYPGAFCSSGGVGSNGCIGEVDSFNGGNR